MTSESWETQLAAAGELETGDRSGRVPDVALLGRSSGSASVWSDLQPDSLPPVVSAMNAQSRPPAALSESPEMHQAQPQCSSDFTAADGSSRLTSSQQHGVLGIKPRQASSDDAHEVHGLAPTDAHLVDEHSLYTDCPRKGLTAVQQQQAAGPSPSSNGMAPESTSQTEAAYIQQRSYGTANQGASHSVQQCVPGRIPFMQAEAGMHQRIPAEAGPAVPAAPIAGQTHWAPGPGQLAGEVEESAGSSDRAEAPSSRASPQQDQPIAMHGTNSGAKDPCKASNISS